MRIVQVRLRLLLIFLVAFLVVGQWDVLRTWFERLTAPRIEPRQQAISTDTEYFCPMDPGVVSDWPARCGVCNMALVRRSRADMGHLPDGVMARMQFSPYRLQIAGIRTAPVEYRPLAYEIVCGGTLRDEADPSGTRRLVVEAEIPRLWAQRLTANSVVEILSPDLPAADPWIAHIRSIEPPANGQRLSWSMLAEFDEPPGELSVGVAVRARLKFPVAETEPFTSLPERSEHAGQVLAVPEAALIPSGQKRIVYVESAPGMFDAVEVRVGARAEGYYPVAQGLKAGQRVAAAGAFLIDAETRLDPHLAASYFGRRRHGVVRGDRRQQPGTGCRHHDGFRRSGSVDCRGLGRAATGPRGGGQAASNLSGHGTHTRLDGQACRSDGRRPAGFLVLCWLRSQLAQRALEIPPETAAPGRTTPMIERIIDSSIRCRWQVIGAALALALLGLYAVEHTPVDAIPDLSENQVIVFADWSGHGPREIEDQLTYPLSRALQGLDGVRVVRSSSDFNFSMLSLIFEERVDVRIARQSVGQALSAANRLLPAGVTAYLAPESPATGQIFWYTIEGEGQDLSRLRAIQDWYVRGQLSAVPGVAEVASVGGAPLEFQIDVDPLRLQQFGLGLPAVLAEIGRSSGGIGGHVLQQGEFEYIVRAQRRRRRR